MISIKSSREVEIMKESCQLAARTLNFIEKKLKVGMTTEEVNQLCHDFITDAGAYPSPLNYHGFPKSVCTSLNEVICHGIPSEKDVLKDGDLLNIDVTTFYKKFHGDTNRTFYIGNVSEEKKKLVRTTYECMMAGIGVCKPGARLGDVGAIIEEIAHDNGYSVVHEYCGHGIGREFHEDPQVLHYGKKGTGVELKPGMTFTIEPMINMGKRHCKLLKDDWTVITKDGKPSAQFEHTILITDDGYEILTLDPDGRQEPALD
ncbi:MAG: type I methionyl aminopeptidase [Halobacteriovoraceae bacterium]|nr:type I methionyl aminopeptidase [Halobacteriovoraceae bacterium]|tara:strand:+ start:102337 stop:103116 length:780 start_codon:yes stop_codon:yes gene_type:complete